MCLRQFFFNRDFRENLETSFQTNKFAILYEDLKIEDINKRKFPEFNGNLPKWWYLVSIFQGKNFGRR